jgi:hypothetical protein
MCNGGGQAVGVERVVLKGASVASERRGGVLDRVTRGDFDRLAPVVRCFHFGPGDVTGEGVFEVWRSPTRRGRILGALLRFPPASEAASVRLVIHRPPAEPSAEPVELWFRRFDDHRMDSLQTSDAGALVERTGPAELRFDVAVAGDGLCFIHTGTRLRWGRWSFRIPRWLAPRVEACVGASPDQDVLNVRVQVSAIGVGPVLRYGGDLEVVEPR